MSSTFHAMYTPSFPFEPFLLLVCILFQHTLLRIIYPTHPQKSSAPKRYSKEIPPVGRAIKHDMRFFVLLANNPTSRCLFPLKRDALVEHPSFVGHLLNAGNFIG